MEPEALALTLPIRRLVEFLLRTGSIDSRFTGFDRALEGARLHRKLQRAAVKEYPDYQAEAALKQDYACAQITYTLEGRADGIFTDSDGMPTIDEIKTTTLPPELITGEQSPEHWAQAQIYAAIYARQNGLPDTQVVRVEKPLNGVLKNTCYLRLEIRKLTSIQNARELFFIVRRPVLRRYGWTDI